MKIIKIPTHKKKGGGPKKYYEIISHGVTYLIGTQHKLYNLRYKMIMRCYKSKPSEFNAYQGKGIQVCNDWKNNPSEFFKWCLDNGWRPGLQIDRLDSNGNYEPSNCQFLTLQENVKKAAKNRFGENTSRALLKEHQVIEIKLLLKNKEKIKDIAKKYKVSRYAIQDIKYGRSWSHLDGKLNRRHLCQP